MYHILSDMLQRCESSFRVPVQVTVTSVIGPLHELSSLEMLFLLHPISKHLAWLIPIYHLD